MTTQYDSEDFFVFFSSRIQKYDNLKKALEHWMKSVDDGLYGFNHLESFYPETFSFSQKNGQCLDTMTFTIIRNHLENTFFKLKNQNSKFKSRNQNSKCSVLPFHESISCQEDLNFYETRNYEWCFEEFCKFCNEFSLEFTHLVRAKTKFTHFPENMKVWNRTFSFSLIVEFKDSKTLDQRNLESLSKQVCEI